MANGLDWDAAEYELVSRWDANLHPRVPGGHGGGQFTSGHPVVVHAGAEPPMSAETAGEMAAVMAGSLHERFGAPDSLTAHTLPDGSLAPARAELHRQIIEDILGGHAPTGGRPAATFLGGGPASGKSTLGGGPAGSVPIDPDEVKSRLPEYQHGVKTGDPSAAAYAHEESSKIAKGIQAGAIGRGLDFTLDGTGDNSYEKMRGKVAAAKQAGYAVHAKYVTVDTEEAVRRSMARAEKTGRMVPETTIREIHAAVSGTFARLIEAGDLDAAELWDTNGAKPVLVGHKPEGGSWTVKDEGAWQRFLAKAK
jgi:predicted ABC-type ATPase